MLLDGASSMPLKCCICKKTVHRATELLLSRDLDTGKKGGARIGRCQECSSIFDNTKFRRLSSRSWAFVLDKLPKARDVKFLETRALMRTEFPEDSCRHLREMTLKRLGTSIMAEHLADVVKGVSVSIMCRHTKCLFYGMTDQWIKHATAKHVRCPQCGNLYKPMTEGPHMLPAQRMLSMMDPVLRHTVCFPVTWKVSRPDTWLASMAEIEAVKIKTGEDLDAFMNESAASLHTFLNKVSKERHFVKMDWNSEMEVLLHPNTFPTAQWTHLKVNGVLGMKMLLSEYSGNVVFDDWQELIGLMAKLLVACKAMC